MNQKPKRLQRIANNEIAIKKIEEQILQLKMRIHKLEIAILQDSIVDFSDEALIEKYMLSEEKSEKEHIVINELISRNFSDLDLQRYINGFKKFPKIQDDSYFAALIRIRKIFTLLELTKEEKEAKEILIKFVKGVYSREFLDYAFPKANNEKLSAILEEIAKNTNYIRYYDPIDERA